MAGATVNLSTFHEIKGDNVQISEDIARWNPVVNGAFAFSKKQLRAGVSVILEIEGSGRISLGIIKIDPLTLKNRPLYKLNDVSEYIQINEVRVHKRKCSIKYSLESGEGKVVAIYNNEKFTQSIKPGSDVWLAVYVKFGEVTMRLNSEEADDSPVLSEVIGMNMEFCTNGKNEVKTVYSNPAAICFIGQPLKISQKISLFCEPLKDGRGEKPSRFYLKIYITDKDPKQLQKQHKNLFTVNTTNKSVPQWVCTRVMDRDNCNGQVTIERAADHVIITNGMNETTREDVSADQKSDLWVALDLYRVLVQQVEICIVAMDRPDGASDGYITAGGDGYITATSSIQQPTQRSLSLISYASVTGNDSDYASVTTNDSGSEEEEVQVRFESSFNGYFASLVSDLTGIELCDHLIALKVITMADFEKINSKHTSHGQNRELLCLLSKRPVPRSKFIAALKESGNGHLIKKFFPGLNTSYLVFGSYSGICGNDKTDAFNASVPERKSKTASKHSETGPVIQIFFQKERRHKLQERDEGTNTDLISSSLMWTRMERDLDRTSLGYWCLCAIHRGIKATKRPWVHGPKDNNELIKILEEINNETITKELYFYLSRQLSYQLMQFIKAAKCIVWPGTILKDKKMVFVCLYKGKMEETTQQYFGKGLVYRDVEKPARNLEFPYTRPKSINNDNNFTYKDASLIEKAIQEHGGALFEKHSNLEAMSGSSFMLSMSKGYIRHPCVVLYCQVKGVVPYGKNAFPKVLKVGRVTLPVDVREGFLRQGMFQQKNIMGRTEWHDKLRMGVSIGVKNIPMAGTLGPFVKLAGNDVGFLTCTHVVGGTHVDILQPADGESFPNRPQFERYCGEVIKICFNPQFRDQNNGRSNTVGVDAALVQVKGNRKIDFRNFPSVPTTDLETAGFNPDDPPLFGYGSIKHLLDFRETQGKRVIKYGRTTGLTKGSLELQGASVRRRDADLELPNKNRVVMTNQYIIEKHGGMPFFLRGDSGAGVFLVGEDNKITLIGLAIGMLDSDYCVVTPIEYVLKALDLRFEDLNFEEDMDVSK
ncbi:hypothetical protein CHS0354_037275 [Potamilus streckersoni]|uniref:CARD domain-containing protein n=1 Tax=Potamilus streckersoni TaxID=2493646 RepID=A0AAE0W3J3_9BIVA|nr:hypothetical protein CHS0354_037275 [Potamilus streckersoni]